MRKPTLTDEELLILLAKKDFVDRISSAIVGQRRISVIDVHLDVFWSKDGELHEFIVMTFIGGGYGVMNCKCNSNSANFRVIGEMLDGNCYGQNQWYEDLKKGSIPALPKED